MAKNKRHFPRWPVTLLATILLMLWTFPLQAADLQPVRLMLQWSHQAQFAGYYVALEKGFYKDKGLDVSIVPGGPGLDAADFLIRGQVDFASLWLSAALARSEKDIPLVNLAQVVNSSNLVLMTWKKDNISTLPDLSGKKISVWGGDFRAPYAAWLQAMNARPEIVPQYYSVNLFFAAGSRGMFSNVLQRSSHGLSDRHRYGRAETVFPAG